MADGTRKAAKEIGKGAEKIAIHVVGQEIPTHDTRSEPAYTMTFQLNASPVHHTQGSLERATPDEARKIL